MIQKMKQNNQNTKLKTLKEIILSPQNIYNAIYCMESYIFERGLLDEEDINLYVRLQDKFNFAIIKETINKCQNRLKKLLDNPDDLFNIKVYFKMKKWDENEDEGKSALKFRPLHTAKLIDQICMVSLLMPLMFDDTTGVRKRSELTKIIPHDFYGNIPSTRMEYLFKPWIQQYKAYNDHIVQKCKEYRENNKYRTEITLDIKEFFPSISPLFMYKYVLDKLYFYFNDPEDKKTLEIVLSKLLLFKISKDDIKGWEENYYSKYNGWKDSKFYMNKGITQGLPQSYFFGNLCMIEIRQKLKEMPVFKNCDAYFYVDDSVIYVESDFDKEKFDKLITEINDKIKDIKNIVNIDYGMHINKEYLQFQKDIEYKITFHEEGKSNFCRIEDAGSSIAGLEPLVRNVSMANAVYSNMDETEDKYSLEKLEKIKELVDDEIVRIKKNIDKEKTSESSSDNQSGGINKGKLTTRLKLLNRYKRFFLYRLHVLEKRLDANGITSNNMKLFFNHFGIAYHDLDTHVKDGDLLKSNKDWFEEFEGDIFQSDARTLITYLPEQDSNELSVVLKNLELNITNGFSGNEETLYFVKDFEATHIFRKLHSEPYRELTYIVRHQITLVRTLASYRQKDYFKLFADMIYDKAINKKPSDDNYKMLEWLPEFTCIVLRNSHEFIRMILNAFYSIQNDIIPNDSHSFIKQSSRSLDYTELRILTRLRNKKFALREFLRFLEDLDAKDLDNRMSIDMGLLEIISIIITKVKKPEWIDNIILTHRVVKGLWYNGSKFMNSYTLHNEEHAVTLIKQTVRLIKAIDYLTIKNIDYYILFLACYLHDISMVIHPNTNDFCKGDFQSSSIISDFISTASSIIEGNNLVNDSYINHNPEIQFKKAGHYLVTKFNTIYEYFSGNIRNTHAYESARYIIDWKDSVLKYLSPLLLSQVAKISESHGWNMEEIYGQKSEAKNSLISEKYTMMLIRLADLMDVANDRINYNLLRQNVTHMGDDSRFHWISHLITDEIRLAPTYESSGDKTLPINFRTIKERLNFNLFLNVKYLTIVKSRCSLENCMCSNLTIDRNIVTLLEEHQDFDGMMLELFSTPTSTSINPDSKSGYKCPVMCKWIVKKHEWMVKELIALNKYLNSVNDRWFKSEIRLNILYRDEFPLDADLYDSVHEYLSK